MLIETPDLKLIDCNQEMLKAIMAGDEQLSQKIEAKVNGNWTDLSLKTFQNAYEKLTDTEELGWGLYLAIHKEENTLVGIDGYKGKPDKDGTVEIGYGYEISLEYRGNDFAVEIMEALIEHAFMNPKVKLLVAYTLGEVNRYSKVLLNCGFKRVERIKDTGEGIMWRWVLKRSI